MADIGTAFIRILPDTNSLNARLGAYFTSSQWSKMGKAAGVAIGAGIAAGGATKALYEVGQAFDDAYDRIRVNTGATGKEMRKLEQSFRDVVATVPVDFETASTAVANLGQRLDQTGKPLTRLAKQMTALSKVTETDVNENIEATTRLFGDWSIRTRKQSETLDKLFRLTHETGIEFSTLSRLMVQFGSPLRQLGFRFDEAAVMFARFEREGVNMETLLPGLRFALKNILVPSDDLAKSFKSLGISTKEPREALFEIFEILEEDKIKEADQTLLASQVFGGRAWADMKAAVEEGRFEFEDLMKTIRDGDVTIRGSERSTRDFAEQWTLFKNNVMLELEPIAKRVFREVGDAMKTVTDIIRDPDLSGGEKLTKLVDLATAAITDAIPKVLEAGKKLALALIEGFLDAGIWGKVALAGVISKMLGSTSVFSAAAVAGSTIGQRFGSAIKLGLARTGIGLAIVGVFAAVDRIMKSGGERAAEEFAEGFGTELDAAIEKRSVPALRKLETTSTKTGEAIEKLGWAGADQFADQTERSSARARAALLKLQGKIRDIAEGFQSLRKSTTQDLDDIQDKVEHNMKRIERELGVHSEAGRNAVRRNFEAAVRAIEKAMKDGRVATDEGGQAIDDAIRRRLAIFGVKGPDAEKLIRDSGEKFAPGGKQHGGLAAIVPGRGVGDNHTLSIDGRPVAKVESREGIFVGNRSLMAAAQAANDRIPRRARGGMVDPAGPGTGVVNSAIANVVGAWSKRYNAAINYGYDPGGGHVSPGHNVTGTATDTGPAAGWTSSATGLFEQGLRAIVSKVDQILYGTAGIGTAYPNHGRGNHAHIEWGLHPDVQGAIAGRFRLPRFKGRHFQGTQGAAGLNMVSRAMEKIMARRVGSTSGADIGPQGGGIFSKSQLVDLWSATGRSGSPNLMAAIALAESGGDPNVTNSIGARGLWQIIPSTAAAFGLNYGRLTDPTLNARGAHSIYEGQGLGAWEAYTNGAYSKYLKRGGLVRLATGGIPGAPPGFELGKFGRSHMKQAMIPRLRKRMGKILRRIARIDEQIDVAGREAQLTSSPGGAELTGPEIDKQIRLNLKLRDRLRDTLGIAKVGERLGKKFGGSGPFREARLEIAGITGTGGRLLDVRETLDGLRATEAAGGIPGQMDIATFAQFAEAIRLGAFRRGGALNFAGGGTVPGRIGAPVPGLLHGGEVVTDGRSGRRGRLYFTVANSGVLEGYIEEIAEDRIASGERAAYHEEAAA